MALPLKEVTLICFDTRNIDAAIESMNFSLGQIHFAESILFTTKALCSDSAINKANKLGIKLEFISQVSSISEYSYFILVNLEKYIKLRV